MLTDEQRDFLAGLRVRSVANGEEVIAAIENERGQPIAFMLSPKDGLSIEDAAHLIVTACHDAATWGKVIEAAKGLHQVRCEYASVVRGGGDEETARDPIREAFANYEHASAALVNCALKVAAALKEGSDEV